RVGTGALAGGCVGAGPRIVSRRNSSSAVGRLRGGDTAICAGDGVVPSYGAGRTVGTIDRAADRISSGIRVIHGGNAITIWIGPVNRVRIRTVPVIRRVVVTSTVNDGGPNHKHSEIACRVTGLHNERGRINYGYIGHVVDRRGGRDLIDLLGDGVGDLP